MMMLSHRLLLLLGLIAASSSVAFGKTSFRTADDPEPEEPPEGWYWGSIDANMDWCERNYETTTYIAEFWNAISSIPIFIYAVVGYYCGKRYAMMETRFSVAFIVVMIVGWGSFAFHATLRRYAQCMDELPMLWASICLFYNAVDHNPPFDDPNWVHPSQSGRPTIRPPPRQSAKSIPFLPAHPYFHRAGLKAILLLCGIILTSIYFYFPGLFMIFFLGYSGFLLSFVVIMSYHIFYSKRAERKNRSGAYETLSTLESIHLDDSTSNGHSANGHPMNPQAIANRPYSPVLGKLFWMAIAGYFGGFIFWMYENAYCTTLPPYMQLHAVWHLMAGLGSFCTIQCQLAWRSEKLGGRTSIDMGLGAGIMPIVVVKY